MGGGIRRALISVSDRTGLAAFAKSLADAGAELLATGGTGAFLQENGVSSTGINDYEMLDGRVKTLHPIIHAGILADRERHRDEMEAQGVKPIDLVCVNLYELDPAKGVDCIDIGGVALLRAAAKNFKYVTAVCNPDDYPRVMRHINKGGEVPLDLRRELAQRVFIETSSYDSHAGSVLAAAE